MTTATDLVLSVSIAFMQLRGKSRRYAEASGVFSKLRLLILDAQLPATIVSVGLLILLSINSYSPFTHIWLGLPLVYPINVLSTMSAKKSLREDIEAEADRRSSSGSVGDEKAYIVRASRAGRDHALTAAARGAPTELPALAVPDHCHPPSVRQARRDRQPDPWPRCERCATSQPAPRRDAAPGEAPVQEAHLPLQEAVQRPPIAGE